MWNLFKVNNKDSCTASLMSWTDFTNCSGVSIFDFEQVNTGWDGSHEMFYFWFMYFYNSTKSPNRYCIRWLELKYVLMSNFPCFLEWAASFWNLFKLLFIYLAFVRYLGEFFFHLRIRWSYFWKTKKRYQLDKFIFVLSTDLTMSSQHKTNQ